MSDRPYCKDCKQLININGFGYIECEIWGSILGYNNAIECPYFEKEEVNHGKSTD